MDNLIKNLNTYTENIKEYPYYKLCKIDKDGDKLLISYKNNNNLPDELLYARTTILCQKTENIICYTFKAKLNYDIFINNNLVEEITIQNYYDGTMINIYYHNDKWCISTKKVIDGFNSKWHSRNSFAELFNQVKKFDYNILDKSCCYSFVLQHKENRIISKIDKNSLILVLVRNMLNMQLIDLKSYQDKGFNIPEIISNKFTSYKAVKEYVNNYNVDGKELDGVMLYGNNEQRTRIMSDRYLKIQSLMGNNRDKMYNILKLQENQDNDINFYYSIFPEHKIIENKLFSIISQLINKLYDIYVLKFIKHAEIKYPNMFNSILYQIHQTYRNRLLKMDKIYAKINHRVVKAIFYQLKYYYQYHLIISYDKYYNEQLTKLS